MCNKIPVAGTFISPVSNFTPSHDWNILSSRKTRLCLLNQSRSFILFHIRNCPFATRIVSFNHQSWLHQLQPHLVFAKTVLKNSAECASARICAVHETYPLIQHVCQCQMNSESFVSYIYRTMCAIKCNLRMYLNPCPYCYCHIKRLSIQLAPETIKASANYTQLPLQHQITMV